VNSFFLDLYKFLSVMMWFATILSSMACHGKITPREKRRAHCGLTAHGYRFDKSAPKGVSGSKVAFASSRDLLLEEAFE